MKKLFYFLFLFFCFSPQKLEADATILGTVTDSVTGLPIAGAFVEVYRGGSVRYSTTTAANGTYIISGIEPSNYTLVISATGYQTQSVGVKANNNQTTTVNVQLVPNGGQINGTVTDATTLLPIAGAIIQVFQDTTIIATVVTNSSGNYLVSNLAAGTYTVLAKASGYQTQIKGAQVQIAVTTTVNFALNTPPGSIQGIVIDAVTTNPIFGATVTVFDGSTIVGFADTDIFGSYAIPDLAPGNYTVVAQATGYQSKAQGATVVANTTTVVNFALELIPGAIAGIVTNAVNMTPIAGATVLVFQNNTLIASVLTGTNGNYSVENLAPGNYTVVAHAPNFAIAIQGASVTANNTTIVNFALSPNTGTLAGKVTDATTMSPIAGVTIEVFDNVILIATAITDSNGNYKISNLAPGEYTVTASVSGYQTQAKNFTITSNATTVVNFALSSSAGAITGKVINAVTTAPISGALVNIFQDMTLIGFARTDSNGQYSVFNLAPGNYFVVAIATGFQAAFSSAVVFANMQTVVDFALNPFASTITGVITDACTGSPVSGAVILVTDGQVIVGFDVSDGQGLFSVASLAPNSYVVRVLKRNYVIGKTSVAVATNATITTNFSLIPIVQPVAHISGRILCNRYLTQTDIIDEITWSPSPSSCISNYLVFQDGVQVASILPSQLFKFVRCYKTARAVTYSVQAINSLGQVSTPVTICF